MNENGYVATFAQFDENLYKEVAEFGVVLGSFSTEDSLLEEHTVTVYALENRKFWVRKCNCDIVDFYELL